MELDKGEGAQEMKHWSDKWHAEWTKRQNAYMESIGARQKLPPLPVDVDAFVRKL
jgi:hypothetical protein